MTELHANTQQIDERESEVESAVSEVVAEFGLRAVAGAVMRNGGAETMGMGGDATLRVIQVVIRQIVFSADPQLEAEVMALGAGVLLADDMTMTKIAEKHGLGRAAISKRVIGFTDELKLPPSQFMKSSESRKVFALTNQPRSA